MTDAKGASKSRVFVTGVGVVSPVSVNLALSALASVKEISLIIARS